MATTDIYTIAERYSRAFFALVSKAPEAAERDAQAIRALIAGSAELQRFLTSPLIGRAQKAQALDTLLARLNAQPATRQFVGRLALNQRLAALPQILERFERLVREARGEQDAEVISASPLSDKELSAIETGLSRATSRKVRVSSRVDPSLIGGVRIKLGGHMLDYSATTQLARLETALKAAAVV